MTGIRVVSDDGAEIVRSRDVVVAASTMTTVSGGPRCQGLARELSQSRLGDHRSFRLPH